MDNFPNSNHAKSHWRRLKDNFKTDRRDTDSKEIKDRSKQDVPRSHWRGGIQSRGPKFRRPYRTIGSKVPEPLSPSLYPLQQITVGLYTFLLYMWKDPVTTESKGKKGVLMTEWRQYVQKKKSKEMC